MKKLRRIVVYALIPATMLLASVTASAVGVNSDKVSVCHRTGSGKSHVITISRNALPAHMRHGDVATDPYGDCP